MSSMILLNASNNIISSNSFNLIDLGLKVIPILLSLGSLGYTVFLNRKTWEVRKRVDIQLDILKANERYTQVKDAKKIFEDALAELIFLRTNKKVGKADIEKELIKTYNKYTAFFNEINEYCNMVNVGAIKANDYIKDTIAVNLSKYASIQYDTFNTLQAVADEYGLKKLNKPDYNAFSDYDKFLLQYNGGENSTFWLDLKTKRQHAGFE